MRPSTVSLSRVLSCLTLAIMALVLWGCEPGESTRPSPTPFEPVSIEALHTALSGATENVRLGEALEEAPEGSTGRALWLGDEPIEVYAFSSSRGRQSAQASLLNREGLAPGEHLWGAGQLLVRYRGGEGGTVLLLSGFLGDPLTIREAPDEPYPPGVTAAIRALAEREGVSPSQVEVVQFQDTTWDDACLEAPREDEQCAATPVAGWRVQLWAAGSIYEVRTDATGEEVRIR